MSNIRIKQLVGPQIKAHIDDLVRLRIEIFRDFPYLYEGSLEYESKYLEAFSQSSESLFVVVFDGDTVVGASTGMPLAQENEEFKQPFLNHSYDPARIFYFAESVLQKEYRGTGLGVRFFEEREAYAKSLGRFEYAAFCTIERPPDHPRYPANYIPLDRFWTNRGYRKHPELVTYYSWQDLDDSEETLKPMIFWMKAL